MSKFVTLMTPEQYAADKRNVCPSCHKESDLQGKGIEIDGLDAFQPVFCPVCDSSWSDTYRRTGFTIIELGDGIEAPKMTPDEYAALEEDSCGVCPVCGEDDISGDECTVDGREMSQECSCADCNSVWMDTYERSGYSYLEAGTPLPEHVAFLQIAAPLRATRAMLAEVVSTLIQVGQKDAVDTLKEDGEDAEELMQIGAHLEVESPTVLRMGTEGNQALYVLVHSVKAPQGVTSEQLRDAIRRLIDIGQTDAAETLEIADWRAPANTKLAANLEIGSLAVSLKEAA